MHHCASALPDTCSWSHAEHAIRADLLDPAGLCTKICICTLVGSWPRRSAAVHCHPSCCLQTVMAAVGMDGGGPSDPEGPTDDAMIHLSQKILPGDPYCCNDASAQNSEHLLGVESAVPWGPGGANSLVM